MPGETLLPNETAPDAALRRGDRAGAARRWRGNSTRTGTGCSSWRRTRRSRRNTCCWSISSTASIRRWRRRSASICASIQGAHGGWPLFHDGAFNLSASVKAYFALKAIGDDPGCAAHGAGAAGDPGGGRRGADQRVHPRAARAVRPGAVARGAGDAAGDHAPAAVVSVPSVEGVVLVAHGDRAAAGADGAAAGGAQSAQGRDPGAVPHAARAGARLDSRAVSFRMGAVLQGARFSAARGAAGVPAAQPAAAPSTRRCASSPSG